jgi:HEPN domain
MRVRGVDKEDKAARHLIRGRRQNMLGRMRNLIGRPPQTQVTGHVPSPGRPAMHKQEVNATSTTSVSLAGIGFGGGRVDQWFRKFFRCRSETVLDRERVAATGVTATRVMGLSLAHNYLDDAEVYLSAAKQLTEDPSHFSPKYFLLSHAIELAIKAYILAKGGSERETKKIKHDLDAALVRAVELGLQPSTGLQKIVQHIAPAHRDYSFRYSNQAWTHFLPNTDSFEGTVAELIKQVSANLPDHAGVLRIT